MNYLALCQRLRLECGISGIGPATVVGQVGEMERLVTWIDAAWTDIQNAHPDWDWLRASASFTTVAGQGTYALGTAAGTVGVLPDNFGQWARYTGRNYVTSVGVRSEVFMDHIGYDEWRDTYFFGALRLTQTRPIDYAIAPDKSLCLGPMPAAGYTITCDYFSAPVQLALDADTPALPTRFHMAIVYRAMMYYGGYEAASEVYQRGELEFGKLMARLDADRLPEITFGGTLA